ncbi:MAG: hypothetical protein AB7P23_07190 [Amphiplicatus sp.]
MGSLHFVKSCMAGAFALSALGLASTSAAPPRDRDAGVSLEIRVGDSRYDDRRYDDRRYDGRHYDDRFDDYGRRGGRIVKREVYGTRYRARIFLTEEVVYRGGRDRDLVCTLDVRGPEARLVPHGQVRHVANRECSRRARIRFV